MKRVRNGGYGPAEAFAYFTETCHTAQLSEALLDRALPDGVHRSHFHIINHLVRGGDGQTPLQIAGAMKVTKATMSHSLAVLERQGLIKTRPSEIDARSKQVLITQAGRALQARGIAALTSLFGSFLLEKDYRTMGEALPSLVAIRKLLDRNRNATPD